jgi:RNA polymerase sigma-70 factor (ECF subfamily)
VTDNLVPPNRRDATSSSLLLRVKAQEPIAWQRLVHLYTPLVCGWCRRAGLQEADALDVGQEVFESVWRSISTFRRGQAGDTFRGWLRTIVRNKIIDFNRRKGGEPAAQGGSEAATQLQQQPAPTLPEPDDEQNNSEISLLCRRALALIRAEFKSKTWRAFEAVVLEDQNPKDVARKLKSSVNAVYLAKRRVLKRLREEFEDLIDT